ncbi:hypothetical protein [Spirochaeta lutea]|uniref:Uncharacterized protein n=1 Tax=Spirochaeta lutea TaxID=1480694 RepID=A0A098R2G6_9SPIO|nr:hypothetical protein [Spirochaeta lutea]KGE73991.1 hypothetical protein DC28_02125 [Spirochaeta lutea]
MKNKSLFLFAIVLFFLTSILYSQTLTIYRDKAPLEANGIESTVIINQSIEITFQAEEYIVLELPPGEYLIYFNDKVFKNSPDYSPWKVELVTLEANENAYLNIEIETALNKNRTIFSNTQPDNLSNYVQIQDYYFLRTNNEN